MCVSCSLHVSAHMCRIARELCVFSIIRSAFVPQRSTTPGFLLTHAAQSPVFANVCRRLASSAAAAASMSTWRRSTGQRSRWYVGKCAETSFTFFFIPSTGEESALDGAEQAAPPGVVHVDAAAARRDEEAVGSISQDTHIQWSLFSLFHPALQTMVSIRFPVVFRSETRGVFLVVLVVWCCLPRKICTMCLLLLSCSRLLTQ